MTRPQDSVPRTLLAAALVLILAILPVYLVGSLGVFIADDLGFTPTRIGSIVSAYYAVSALVSVPGGRVVERLGIRRSMLTAGAIAAGAMLAIGLAATSWFWVAAFLAFAGIANGMGQPSANLSLIRSVPQRALGTAFGIKQSSGPIATLAAGSAVPIVAQFAGWRATFVTAAGLFVLLSIAVPRVKDAAPATGTRPVVRREPGQLPLAVVSAFGAGAAATAPAFLVVAVVDRGGPAGLGGVAIMAGSLVAIGVRLVAGFTVDRSSRFAPSMMVVMLLATGAAGFGVLAVASSPVAWIAGAMLVFGAGWGWPGVFHHSVAALYSHAPAAATGVTMTGVYLGSVLAPPVFGLLAEFVSFTAAWSFSGTLGLGGALVMRRVIAAQASSSRV
ncbi:MAG: MFS transporter [Nitriliruptoraceae bacterium]